MTNLQIAELLRNVASAYQYRDQNKYRFQIMAYERASDAIEHSTSELKDLWDDGKLDEIPGIGTSIAKHLDEIFKTGKSKHFEELMKDIPNDAFILMALPKVGIKTAMKMITELSKSEIDKKIEEAKKLINTNKRQLLPHALEIASEVMEWLKNEPDILNIDVLGSARRKVATVGDIDILVSSNNPNKIMDRFVNYPKSQKIIEKGEHTSSILLPGNIQVDILVCEPESYGSSLQHFTGSKMHNIKLRELALKNGYSVSEYGVKKLADKEGEFKKFDSEEKFYNFLGVSFVPPELREGLDEIDIAKENKLPNLVELKDIKGDLQIHSDFDIETSHDVGTSSIQEIVNKAKTLNYEYIALTEHNPSKKGHTSDQVNNLLIKKREMIREKDWGIKVFNSLEIDMGKDGNLPVSDDGLDLLDFALVSIHSNFDLSREAMTKRVLTALAHPKVKIFAHPTGRKINEREGVELDWEKVFDFCVNNDKWIEINCDPMRLDLPDTLVRDAITAGIKLTLGTDTHHVSMMDNIKYGVWVARRGWCEKKNIINTRNLQELQDML